MTKRRNLLKLLLSNKRIDLTQSGFSLTSRLFIVFVFVLVHFILFLGIKGNLSYGRAAGTLVVSGITTISLIYLYTHLQAISLKGDMIIFKSLNNSSKITSINSVRNVRSIRILGIYVTFLQYSLDGNLRKAIMLTRSAKLPSSPEKAMKKAIRISKKEKANHKPGSVSRNESGRLSFI